ncbi:MAG: hypothetical protein AMXMBFR48_25450 [Ignavibacteriales bacterium]|jgi:cytochrome c1
MKKLPLVALLALAFLLAACSDKKDTPEPAAENPNKTNEFGLTEFEMENGVGPIKTKLTLGEIDMMKVKDGEKIFTEKCSACHKLDERYVGPSQADLLSRRTPEYVVNMIMNPDEMLRKHPEAKKMLAEYMTPMPFQNVTMEDALKLLDYFRYTDSQNKK